MQELYDVYSYNISKLISILESESGTPREIIKWKFIYIYFKNYFEDLNAQTIIVENKYIDHDFLNDYSEYYVKCFKSYNRTCTRLHFFNIKFTKKDFKALLCGSKALLSEKKLNDAYLGFVVVKPLPETIIGRTCLKTYDDNDRRNYPIVRTYSANLYGIDLKINSLAFQEQDNVVAACATSALWSVFQASGILYQHQIPSPVEITKSACNSLPAESRFLPNKGLTIPQMANAIRSVNLEPFLISASNEEVLKSTLYAYLAGEIPLIMTFLLVDVSKAPGVFVDFHAVAITGYSLGLTKPIPNEKNGFLLKASRIDKIYAHDDQVGPFSRIVLDQREIEFYVDKKNLPVKRISMETSWIGKNKKIGSMRAVANNLLIPVYHKIRIPFSDIKDTVIHFDEFIEELRSVKISPLKQRVEWNIYLTTINKFKQDILKKKPLNKQLKYEILTESMPRFLWRAEAVSAGKHVLDLIFDATDILQGLSLKRAIGFDEVFFNLIKAISKETVVFKQYRDKPVWKILKWFATIDDNN